MPVCCCYGLISHRCPDAETPSSSKRRLSASGRPKRRLVCPIPKRRKLVKKSFGRDRGAAIEYVEKARTLRRTGEGHVPKTACGIPKTARELEARAIASSVLVSELCDDLLRHIQSKSNLYKDQRNPPYRIGLIRAKFGDRPAVSIRPFEIADWLDGLGHLISVNCGGCLIGD